MRPLPDSLGGRLLLAFVVAAAAIAVLAIAVRERDEARAAERRSTAAPPEPEAPEPAFRLAPCRGRVLLARRLDAIAPDVAPVVQVFADGATALRRPAPLATSPAAEPTPGDAAILVPDRSLAALAPAARTALLDVLGRLVPERPVPAERVQLVDLPDADAGVRQLLSWLP